MRIFIESAEPLLFRTGRPFTASEHNFAESLFPPTPETMQGAIRSVLADQWGRLQHPPILNPTLLFQQEALKALIGDRTTYGSFRITGFSLGRRDPKTGQVELLFPAPAHIIKAHLKDGQGRIITQLLRLLPRKPKEGTATNMPEELHLLFPESHTYETAEKSEALEGWLTTEGLRVMLRGLTGGEYLEEREEHLLKNEQIFIREERMGIGMNNSTKTTKEGNLYQTQMIRMLPDNGFVVDISFGEEEIPSTFASLKEGWLTLGGEQRAAYFEILPPQKLAREDVLSRSKEGNLLYFATPAYFASGWLSNEWAPPLPRPIAAALNRYQSIGGWVLNSSNADGEAKMMRRCIPAGSVYFFDQPVNVAHPVTEYGWQIGYGITYTGEWK